MGRLSLCVTLWVLTPGLALAQVATRLNVPDVTAHYSDGPDITVELVRASDSTPVAGAMVVLNVRDADRTFNVDVGQVVTGANGRAVVRVPLVNGCPLWGTTVLQGGTTAAPRDYVLEASFAGDMISGEALIGSVGTGALHVVKETAQVQLVSGTSAELGEMLTITARIVDDNGDAPCDRSAPNGGRSTTVEAHRLAFFWDVNADRDYSDVREQLGSAMTTRANPDVDAVASVTTDTSPINNLPRAGTLENALQVQLPADDGQYLPATAVGRLVLLPAPVAPERTTLTANPETAPAGGSAPVEITVTVRDRFDNPLGVDAPVHAVAVEIEGAAMGASLQEPQATRDPVTGLYKQTLLAPNRKGTVALTAVVDGARGGHLEVTFSGVLPFGPCVCSRPAAGLPWAVLLLGVVLRRARPRRIR